MNAARIIIIAKEPRPGLAKTRLIPALGAQGAAELADRLLQHAVTQALAADLGPVELCVTPDQDADYWRHWRDNSRIDLTQQAEGDLGVRMATAAEQGLASGLPVILMGTDCPLLEAARLQAMATALTQQDACLCPVLDGGYSLLGLRRFDASLFSDIPWSTDQVTALTRDRLRQLDWVWHESEPLWDLDEPEDLARLQHYPSLSGRSI
jgi:rSAM/selenodomain-associated transferase 1